MDKRHFAQQFIEFLKHHIYSYVNKLSKYYSTAYTLSKKLKILIIISYILG